MEGVFTKGTATSARFKGMPIAGKTGTANEYRDVWLAGYSPYYTCTVWSGYDNNLKMINGGKYSETGVSKALWKSVMSRIHEDLPAREFVRPEDIIELQICSKSGKLPIPGLCDAHLTTELYAAGSEPLTSCDIHYQGEICAVDGLPASYPCPFKYQGTAQLPLIEPTSLLSGSTIITENEDGTQTIQMPNTATHCQHDEAFMAQPDAWAIIDGQRWQLQNPPAAQ